MNSHRFNLCISALAVFIVIGAQTATAQPATQPANDIELGKPVKYPTLITPTVEGGGLLDDHHGDPITQQKLVFNPATHELALKNSPGQRSYGDCRIDSANYGSDLTLFDYRTTDGTPIGQIIVTCARKKVVISYNYVISLAKDKPAPIDPASYCASVQFVKGDECNKPGTTVTLHRNADPPTPLADAEFSKINRKTDVITWTLDRGGATVKTGSFGFPVVATEPGLVKYVVQLP